MSLAVHSIFCTKSIESYTPKGFIDFKIPNVNVIQGECQEYLIPKSAPFQCKNGER